MAFCGPRFAALSFKGRLSAIGGFSTAFKLCLPSRAVYEPHALHFVSISVCRLLFCCVAAVATTLWEKSCPVCDGSNVVPRASGLSLSMYQTPVQ